MRKLLITISFLVILLLIILPFLGITFGAFEEGFQPFWDSLKRPEALHALKISLIIVVIVTILNTIVGVYVSLAIVRGTWIARWLKPIINAIIDLPFAVSPIIVGLMVILIFGPNTALGAFMEDHNMKIVYAIPGMVLATMFITFPLMVREVVPLLEEIGTQSEEASATLGAGAWRTFIQITWPGIRWGVLYGLILTVARSLGEFGSILVVSGNIINQTQTATTLVYQDAEQFQLVAANSLAFVLGLISISILLSLEWLKRRSEHLRNH
ncbi:sulfate ABC transporter permease subunit [Paenibacillus alba]|uniref:Sulfate ABC transporter permease subunit n=1 Tax=Paenibacillus alba TaxID=1197127 RepID=A0ABU6G710_9BACL|nr:sulfate ABC transporter permease subunit [Paenibacillus alba]MEC0229047.1 sulfate ABC transporter permease subunit [Paenibacillus alba]NQX64608.1 sulfate ABC transporter permease subunit [Paenibacillus alba]